MVFVQSHTDRCLWCCDHNVSLKATHTEQGSWSANSFVSPQFYSNFQTTIKATQDVESHAILNFQVAWTLLVSKSTSKELVVVYGHSNGHIPTHCLKCKRCNVKMCWSGRVVAYLLSLTMHFLREKAHCLRVLGAPFIFSKKYSRWNWL